MEIVMSYKTADGQTHQTSVDCARCCSFSIYDVQTPWTERTVELKYDRVDIKIECAEPMP